MDKNRFSRIYGYGSKDGLCLLRMNEVEENPENKDCSKDRDKGPGAAKGSNLVSHPLPEGQVLGNVF